MSFIVFDIETGPLPMDPLQEILQEQKNDVCFHNLSLKKKKKRVELPASYLNQWRQYIDDSRRDDSSYWAAALVLAIKSGNRSNEFSARANLRRLGLDVVAYGETVLPSGDKAALSAMTGRVVAIGFTDINGVAFADCINDPNSDEITLLCKFWDLYESCRDRRLNMIGFNSDDFDLPFLCQRSIIHGVKPPSTVIQNKRFLDSCFIDLRKLWGFGKLNPSGSLDTICRACGIGSKPQGIDGSQFSDLYFNSETRDVALAYLMNDLKMTFALAQRLIGSSDDDYGISSLESS